MLLVGSRQNLAGEIQGAKGAWRESRRRVLTGEPFGGLIGGRRMSNTKTFQALSVNGRWAFFMEFLKYPFQIGSIVPSSRFLERRIVETSGIKSAKTVAELGPGIGGTTRAILRAMAKDARLLTI